MSATFRLTILFSGLFALSTLVLFGVIYGQTAAVETSRIDGILIDDAAFLGRQNPAALSFIVDGRMMPDLRPLSYLALFSGSHERLNGNMTDFPGDLPIDGRVHRLVMAARWPGSVPEVVRAVGTALKDGRVLVIARNIDSLDNLRAAVIRALILGLIPALLLSLAAGAVVSGRTYRQVKLLHATLDRIMAGSLDERLPVRGSGDDFDRLATRVNAMLDEIARLMEDMKSTGDNIAHDLRTPLTRVRTRLERARHGVETPAQWQEVIDRATAGLDQALRLITALLRIGDIEAGHRRAAFQDIDLGRIAAEIAELYEPFAEAKGVALSLCAPPVRRVRGDHDLLCELLSNLVDNAVKFTPSGGVIAIALLDRADGPVLSVADSGPGIAPAQRDTVFQRFTRSDASRSIEGYGLGLSLVAAIAKLHGFRVEIADHHPGCVFSLICAPL